jgi:hypothetical protein
VWKTGFFQLDLKTGDCVDVDLDKNMIHDDCDEADGKIPGFIEA